MSQSSDDERFRKAREAFDDMNLEAQTSFLLEATVRTVARGAETVGRALGDEIDRMFDRGARGKSRHRREGPGPAEPETAQQRASGSPPDDDQDDNSTPV